MIRCIAKELLQRKDYLNDQGIDSIYFGGGSPSILSSDDIGHLLQIIKEHYTVSASCEVTLEANPDDMQFDYLQSLQAIGINRLSVGIQSFNDVDLQYMNRAHTGKEAEEALEHAQSVGFTDFSIDLIYGAHTTTDLAWEKNIEYALRYTPTHISTYCMTIEDATVFGHWKAKGKLEPIDEEKANRQFAMLQGRLATEGYLHYEISNFAKEGHYAVHNSNYWKGHHYLGVGPAAHSFDGVSRGWNPAHNAKYMESINNGKNPFIREVLSIEDQFNEYIMTGLRTMWGVDLTYVKTHFGEQIGNNLIKALETDWIATKVIVNKSNVKLNAEGKNFADRIASECFI